VSRPAPYSATTRLLDALTAQRWEQPTPTPTRMEELVRDCLDRMRRRDRDLLLARYYEQLTYRQIADMYDWDNRGSAHWAVRRALDELRRRVTRAAARKHWEEL